jgi:hypothetical protein
MYPRIEIRRAVGATRIHRYGRRRARLRRFVDFAGAKHQAVFGPCGYQKPRRASTRQKAGTCSMPSVELAHVRI